jgi:hypothetical protein
MSADWLSSWAEVCGREELPEVIGDRRKFLDALASTGSAVARLQSSDWGRSVNPQVLHCDCVNFCRPLARPGPGIVKLAYVSTRPDVLSRVLQALLCLCYLGRSYRIAMPMSWLVFPVKLIDSDRLRLIESTFEALKTAAPDENEARSALGLSESHAERTAASDLSCHTVILGSSCRIDLERLRANQPDLAERIGLPICVIPSRRVSEIEISAAPWRPTMGETV